MTPPPNHAQIANLRAAIPRWIDETVELVELAKDRERAGNRLNPEKLTDGQARASSPRLHAELRILQATLDASMDEANAAARELILQ